jgi:hypothetical protein
VAIVRTREGVPASYDENRASWRMASADILLASMNDRSRGAIDCLKSSRPVVKVSDGSADVFRRFFLLLLGPRQGRLMSSPPLSPWSAAIERLGVVCVLSSGAGVGMGAGAH